MYRVRCYILNIKCYFNIAGVCLLNHLWGAQGWNTVRLFCICFIDPYKHQIMFSQSVSQQTPMSIFYVPRSILGVVIDD